MRTDTASPFRIAFPGPAAGLDPATPRGNRMRLRGLRLGTARIGRTYCSRAMLAALRQADADSTVRLGHLLVGRWVLSVSAGGRTVRRGRIGFLLGNLLLGLAIMLPVVTATEIATAAAGLAPYGMPWPFFPAAGLWMALAAMNYAAWFGFPRRPA